MKVDYENLRGRPSIYNDDLVDELLFRMVCGESIATICSLNYMPSPATIYRWRRENDEFRELYARAREDQGDTFADQILAIADENPELEPVYDKDGNIVEMRIHPAWVANQKNRIDVRKWLASKFKSKSYGDKVDVTSGGDKVGFSINIDMGHENSTNG